MSCRQDEAQLITAPDIHSGTPAERVAGLLALLDVAPRGEGLYEGPRKHGAHGRIFGGEVIAQALAAACKTVPADRKVHSVHAYFLRGGNEDYPAEFQVAADFEGRSFSNRRVIASQRGEVILNLTASFHIDEPGHHHQATMPDVASPEIVLEQSAARLLDPSLDWPGTSESDFLTIPWPIEMRSADGIALNNEVPAPPETSYWFRIVAPVDAPQWMHRAMLAYISDMGILSPSLFPHRPFDLLSASIDHSLWFHRDVQVDDWLLYNVRSPWAGGARGLGFAHIFDRAGNLVASVAQEGLIRDRALRG